MIDAAMPEQIARPIPAGCPFARLGPPVAHLSEVLFTLLEWNAVAKHWQLKPDVAQRDDSTLEQVVALAVRKAVVAQPGAMEAAVGDQRAGRSAA